MPFLNKIALLLCLFALNSPMPAIGRSVDQIALDEGADRNERLRAAARQEGSLLLYTTTPVEYVKILTSDFERKFGVKVNIWRSRSENVLQRIISEARGGHSVFDVAQSISPSMEALHREKLLQEVRSPHFKDLIPAAIPAHKEWVATLQYVFVQAYNTTLVKKPDLPKTYTDLLDPKWKGRLGIESSDHEWFYSVVKDMGEEKGLKFFRDLMETNGLSVRTGHPLLTNLVASGEVPLALTVYNYMPEQLKQKGVTIDWFAIEPAIAIPDGMGISRKAPHPHAAVLFYDYMLSEDAQKLLAKIGYVPTNKKVESPLKKTQIKLLDPATLVDEADKSTRLYDEILIKRSAK